MEQVCRQVNALHPCPNMRGSVIIGGREEESILLSLTLWCRCNAVLVFMEKYSLRPGAAECGWLWSHDEFLWPRQACGGSCSSLAIHIELCSSDNVMDFGLY